MATQAKWEEARKKIRGPVELAARRLFSSPDGEVVLDALVRAFLVDPVATLSDGAVDASGTLVNVGAAKVINYLRELAELREETGT